MIKYIKIKLIFYIIYQFYNYLHIMLGIKLLLFKLSQFSWYVALLIHSPVFWLNI